MAWNLVLHDSLTEKQKKILRTPKEHLIIRGPAGTSKSYIALARGLKLLQKKQVKKLIIIRSAVEIRPLGHLPGDQHEKIDVYSAPYVHLFKELTGNKRPFSAFVAGNEVEFHSTSYLRGQTFDDAYIIVDEYQNMNKHELETIVTRVGDCANIVLCGDSDQSDLKYNEAHEHHSVLQTLERMPDFEIHEFTTDDIVRSEFVKRYYQAKEGHDFAEELPPFIRNQPFAI